MECLIIAFPMDYTLRQKINAIPGIFKLFKAITEYYVPLQKQEYNLDCIAVGPNQYPNIYKMGEECARRLGIGVPQIFIQDDIATFNAFTIATNDTQPMVVLTTAIVERLSENELKTIIGHECGHIQNNHGIYTIAAQMMAGTLTAGISSIPGLQQLIWLFSLSTKLLFNNWSRCAEVTCDRAGMICSDNSNDAVIAMSKLAFSGSKALENMNIDEFIKQIDRTRDSVIRFKEFLYDHPITSKRVLANKMFQECEVLYSWRPEWKKAEMTTKTKTEIDKQCESFISVTTGKKFGGKS